MQKVVPVGQSGRALCEDARADPGQHQAQKGQEPMARGKGSQMPARSGKNGDSASELSLSQTFIYIYIYIVQPTYLRYQTMGPKKGRGLAKVAPEAAKDKLKSVKDAAVVSQTMMARRRMGRWVTIYYWPFPC